MARPAKPKTGVMPGFPKLAFYTGPTKILYLGSSYYAYYDRKTLNLNTEDLVVLVATGKAWDYSRRIPGTYNYTEIPLYYFVPVQALETNMLPINCIYNWKQKYKSLPFARQELFTLIERKDSGERIITPTVAA